MPGITLAELIQIVTVCDRDISQEDVATIRGHGYCYVNKVVNSYHHEGRLENLPLGFWPRETTADEDERILNVARRVFVIDGEGYPE
ncbi:hypothetical protein HPB48_015688 [Haemaphysalis longicornis]|uniref:Uncharacterized protein n=1 Tax=Haemaphysalis longicornis TaxID=44386 RepID=A0A9J6FY76_HAELO|nr:hypothetical protein HPB48_015688 [Haemaphysalis longicornis]